MRKNPPVGYERPDGFGGLVEDVMISIFDNLSSDELFAAAKVNWHWRMCACFFALRFFKRDFPEVFNAIQTGEHEVKNWWEEYLAVRQFADCLPTLFASQQYRLVKDWQKLFIQITSYDRFYKWVSSLYSRGISWEKGDAILKVEGVIQIRFQTGYINIDINPFSPMRRIERVEPKFCAEVRYQIWNIIRSNATPSTPLPRLAVLTHQPIERLREITTIVNEPLIELACQVHNLEAYDFLCTRGEYFSNDGKSITLAYNVLQEANYSAQYDLFIILADTFEKKSQVHLDFQPFMYDRSFDQVAAQAMRDERSNHPLLGRDFKSGKPLFFLKFLVEKKQCNPNLPDAQGFLPLHYQCLSSFPNLQGIEYLIEQGNDVNAKTSEGATPILTAILSGNKPLIRLLLKKGALITNECFNINEWQLRGTVLNFALYIHSRENRLPLLKFLIEELNIDVADCESKHSLFSSLYFGINFHGSDDSDEEVFHYLVSIGADPLLFCLDDTHLEVEDDPCSGDRYYSYILELDNILSKILELAFDKLLDPFKIIDNKTEKFLKNLKKHYNTMLEENYECFSYRGTVGLPESTRRMILLWAIAVNEPIEKIRIITDSIKNLFADPRYEHRLFCLCYTLYPAAHPWLVNLKQEQEIIPLLTIEGGTFNAEDYSELQLPGNSPHSFFQFPEPPPEKKETHQSDDESAGYDNPNDRKRIYRD